MPNMVKIDNMKLSIFCPFEDAYLRPKNWGFGGLSPRKWSTKPQEATSAVRKGSRGVLIMSVSSVVPDKSRENKKCDEEELEEEEELRHIVAVLASL